MAVVPGLTIENFVGGETRRNRDYSYQRSTSSTQRGSSPPEFSSERKEKKQVVS